MIREYVDTNMTSNLFEDLQDPSLLDSELKTCSHKSLLSELHTAQVIHSEYVHTSRTRQKDELSHTRHVTPNLAVGLFGRLLSHSVTQRPHLEVTL